MIIGEITLPLSIITGFIDAGSITFAANQPILSFKIRMAMVLFFVLLSPIMINIYSTKLLKSTLFEDERFFTIFYILLLFVGTLIILIIGAAGGYYVYSHSFFDTIGLGEYFPELIPKNLKQNIYDSYNPSIFGFILYFIMITFPFILRKK